MANRRRRESLAISWEILETLRCEETCGICEAPINLKSELYDPFPIIDVTRPRKGEKPKSNFCCPDCFYDAVLPMRTNLLLKRLYAENENIWRGFEIKEKDGDLNIPMITMNRERHYYLQKDKTACGLNVANIGRHLSTRRNASWTKLNCPECINKIHEQYSDFFANYGVDEL